MKIGIIDDKSSSGGGPDPPDPPDPVGGFPAIVSITVTQDTTNPLSARMPATVNAGDLLILLSGSISPGGTSGAPAGWTFLDEAGGFSSNISAYYKWAVGNEDGDLVQVYESGADQLFAVIRIIDALGSQAPEVSLDDQASTNSPNPPSIDPSWATADNLIIAVVLTIDPRNVSSYPSGYPLYHYAISTSGGSMFAAAKEVEVSTAQDPGSFNLSGSTSCYVATIAVRGG